MSLRMRTNVNSQGQAYSEQLAVQQHAIKQSRAVHRALATSALVQFAPLRHEVTLQLLALPSLLALLAAHACFAAATRLAPRAHETKRSGKCYAKCPLELRVKALSVRLIR
eukprot:11184-Heterococcus_DN1.PRE.1